MSKQRFGSTPDLLLCAKTIWVKLADAKLSNPILRALFHPYILSFRIILTMAHMVAGNVNYMGFVGVLVDGIEFGASRLYPDEEHS